MTAETQRTSKLERIALLEKKRALQEGLPFLHGWKHYNWSRAFFESRNKENFLVAANQIGKSSVQIRRAIDHATNVEKWPILWRTRPLTFWYLYPTKEVATIEFWKKWVPEFLPRGEYKSHPVYGWREEVRNKNIFALHFNSGVSIYFKSYAQDAADLQTGTCWEIFCDEELPEDLYSELNMRRSATDGVFNMVFTATLGQIFWEETMEDTGESERFKTAFKQRVSLFDCLNYEDGSDSHWSEERIHRIMNSCKSEAEIQRRVYGKFVRDEGLKYQAFDRKTNVIQPIKLPPDCKIYAGVDIGSGGSQGHPAAVTFIAVMPDYSKGWVFKGWRGDGQQTTCSDIMTKFQAMRGSHIMSGQFYDWQSRDFLTIAQRIGEPFVGADKGHDTGEQIINVLFKNKMLYIFDIPELRPLVAELCSLQRNKPKAKSKDDACDSLRYGITKIPWDWSVISAELPPGTPAHELSTHEREADDRRKFLETQPELDLFDPEIEMDGWNELYD